MAFDLEKFYEEAVFSFARLSCVHQQLLIVRDSIRNEIKLLKRRMKTAKRDRGLDYKDCNDQVATATSSEIGKAKIQRKQLSNQLKKVQKRVRAEERIFNEVFPYK